jgi:hypothetical protein
MQKAISRAKNLAALNENLYDASSKELELELIKT